MKKFTIKKSLSAKFNIELNIINDDEIQIIELNKKTSDGYIIFPDEVKDSIGIKMMNYSNIMNKFIDENINEFDLTEKVRKTPHSSDSSITKSPRFDDLLKFIDDDDEKRIFIEIKEKAMKKMDEYKNKSKIENQIDKLKAELEKLMNQLNGGNENE